MAGRVSLRGASASRVFPVQEEADPQKKQRVHSGGPNDSHPLLNPDLSSSIYRKRVRTVQCSGRAFDPLRLPPPIRVSPGSSLWASLHHRPVLQSRGHLPDLCHQKRGGK